MKLSGELIYELWQIEAENLDETQGHFIPRDSVKIKEGPYHYHKAVYQIDDRSEHGVVLFSILDKGTSVKIKKVIK